MTDINFASTHVKNAQRLWSTVGTKVLIFDPDIILKSTLESLLASRSFLKLMAKINQKTPFHGCLDHFIKPYAVRLGSLISAVGCMCFAFFFFIYGIWLVRKIQTLSKAVSNTSGQQKNDSITKRFTVVTLIASLSFIAQSVIVITSRSSGDAFFSMFTTVQALYLVFDVCLLSSVIYLYYHVVKEYFDRSQSLSSQQKYSVELGTRKVVSGARYIWLFEINNC